MKTFIVLNSKKVLFTLVFVAFSIAGFAQSKSGYSFFQIVNSGKTKRGLKEVNIKGTGQIDLNGQALSGSIAIRSQTIYLSSQTGLLEFSTDDTSIKKLTLFNGKNSLQLVRLSQRDNKLWRLLKDTLGMKVYDKNIAYPLSEATVDYETLLFEKNGVFKEAFTFWTTSTKKNVITIVSTFLGIDLKPGDFMGKEDFMKQFLAGEPMAYQKQ